MSQQKPSRLLSFVRGLAIVLATAIITNVFATALVMAWANPSSSPPAGNVAAPVNVGPVDQIKDGSLGVNGLAVFGNTLLRGNSYLNFGVTAGSSGYGIRDNNGLLEFKTATGTWQSIQAIITTTVGSSTSWQSGPNGSIYYSAGNVGIGASSAPVAALDVAGAMRLAPRTAAPVTCSASYIGSIAVSDSTSHICICNGTAWVYDYNGAACVWGTGGVTPGSQSYTTAGTYTFTVPAYNSLTVTVWGGGGGGGTMGGAPCGGSGGGSGGYASITYSAGVFAPGSTITVIVGAGGAPGSFAGTGAVGRVSVSWN